MAGEWKLSVCGNPNTTIINNINDYVGEHSFNSSPIDSFYHHRREVLRPCTPQWVGENPIVSPLMVVGLISGVENYYRELLSRLIKICPITKRNASNKTISMSSIYFGYENLERGVFEHQSFADSNSVKKLLKNVTGLELNNQIEHPLVEFQKICELRHSIVHSSNIIASKNAIELDLPSNKKHYIAQVNYDRIQETAEICTNLVRATNLTLFEKYITKWAYGWRQLPSYAPDGNHKKFKELWQLFHSHHDFGTGDTTEQLSLIRAKNMIKRELNL